MDILRKIENYDPDNGPICDASEFADEAYGEIKSLRQAFKHIHINNGIDDACRKCGFDLRNPIHAVTL